MRIGYHIWSLGGGGAEMALPRVVAALQAEGHQVDLTAYVPCNRLALPRIQALDLPFRLAAESKRGVLLKLLSVYRQQRRSRPDLLITSLPGATIVGQLLGVLLRVPVVSWQHSARLSLPARLILSLTHRLTTRWIADCEPVADYLHAELGIPRAKIFTWPLFVADPDWPLASPDGEPLRIGMVGRLHALKGPDFVIETARVIRERAPGLAEKVEFLIAGDGPEHDRLERRITALGLDNVRCVGFQEDVRAFLKSLAIYMQPSRHEGSCIAALEAMATGLPIVASAVGGLRRSVLPDANGFLCPPGDIESYAAALLRLIRDPELRRRLGSAGRERVLAAYSPARFQGRARALLRSVVTDQPIAGAVETDSPPDRAPVADRAA